MGQLNIASGCWARVAAPVQLHRCQSVGLAVHPEIMESLLLDIGQDGVRPVAGLISAGPAIGVARPLPTPSARGKKAVLLLVVSIPSASCLMLLVHCTRRAASRAACTAGSNSAIKMPMIVMTTKSSTRVKPEGFRFLTPDVCSSRFIIHLSAQRKGEVRVIQMPQHVVNYHTRVLYVNIAQ